MRNIYSIFIIIFVVFILLELNFKPSKKIVEPEVKTELVASNYTEHQVSETITPNYLEDSQQQYHDIEFSNKSEEYQVEIPEDYEFQTPDPITWSLLGKIKYEKKAHKDYPEGVMFPIVNQELKAKKGKKITISGFIIPIDESSYALSKNVFASCFFCGQAGPETIMGIKFKNLKKRLKTDQYVTLEGIFRYNETDVEDWIYHIENAIITKGE